MTPLCAHQFKRRPFWWLHSRQWMRWICIHCGMTTRTYDAADFMGMRPLHPHMTVAAPGYNTMGERSESCQCPPGEWHMH